MRYLLLTKRSLFTAMLLALSAILVTAGVSRQYRTQSAANTGERKIPIYCVETDEKKVAITFDAAWGAEDTDELLEILAAYQAKATVFVVGDWVRQNPDAVKAFSDAGHSIANHSDTHTAYSKLSYEEIKADIQRCNAEIEKCINKSYLELFRSSNSTRNIILHHTQPHLSLMWVGAHNTLLSLFLSLSISVFIGRSPHLGINATNNRLHESKSHKMAL